MKKKDCRKKTRTQSIEKYVNRLRQVRPIQIECIYKIWQKKNVLGKWAKKEIVYNG